MEDMGEEKRSKSGRESLAIERNEKCVDSGRVVLRVMMSVNRVEMSKGVMNDAAIEEEEDGMRVS